MPEPNYTGRVAFLKATTTEMKPAPIDDLLELLPVFRTWRRRVVQDARNAPVGERIEAHFTAPTCTISQIDNSPEAAALKDAIYACMERHRFDAADSWISAAALCTLYRHAAGRAHHPREWYFMKTWYPVINVEPRRGIEKDDAEYLARYDKEYSQQSKDARELTKERTGIRVEDQQQVAKWTARVFALGSDAHPYATIARTEKNMSRNTIRISVVRFADSIGLQLPTLADSLAGRTGKAGKYGVMQGG